MAAHDVANREALELRQLRHPGGRPGERLRADPERGERAGEGVRLVRGEHGGPLLLVGGRARDVQQARGGGDGQVAAAARAGLAAERGEQHQRAARRLRGPGRLVVASAPLLVVEVGEQRGCGRRVAPAVEGARLEAGAAQLQRRPLDGGRAPGEQDGRAFLAGVPAARGAQAGSPLLVRSAGWIGRRSLLTPNSGVPMAAAPLVTSAQCAWFASWMLKQALSAV